MQNICRSCKDDEKDAVSARTVDKPFSARYSCPFPTSVILHGRIAMLSTERYAVNAPLSCFTKSLRWKESGEHMVSRICCSVTQCGRRRTANHGRSTNCLGAETFASLSEWS